MSERALLAQWRAGDRGAGEKLIELYVPILSAFLSPRAGGYTADLVQLSLLALVQGSTDPESIRSLRAYLLGIARNQYLMWQRKLISDRTRVQVLATADLQSSVTTPSQRVARDDRRAAILAQMRELPEYYQTTLELHYWHHLSVHEIAEAMDTKVGTVKARLTRGRAMLGQRLREVGVEF